VVSLLCCSPHTRCTADQAPYMHLFGDTHLTEMLEDFKFQVSPDSFFQVNTAAAAVLYKTVMHLAGLTHVTTLLDVCCGTGQVCYCSELLLRTRLSFVPESGGNNNIMCFQVHCKAIAQSSSQPPSTCNGMAPNGQICMKFHIWDFYQNLLNMPVLVKVEQQ